MPQSVALPRSYMVGKLALVACALFACGVFAIAGLNMTLSRAASHFHGVAWHPQKVPTSGQ